MHLCSCAAIGHSSWSRSGSHAPAQSVPPPRCGHPAVTRRSLLVMGSLGLPWSVHHGSPAAHDAAGIVFRMALPILPASAIAVCISSSARQQLIDVRPDLRPGGGSATEAIHSTSSCPGGISLAPVSALGFLLRVLCIARRQSAVWVFLPRSALS